jgi:hypothetical protein
MKLRIIECFDQQLSPWFRLQQWDGVNANWTYVHSSNVLCDLEAMAERLFTSPLEPRVVKEFSDESKDFVDTLKPMV